MSLIKITDLTAQLGLSSRSLRYYEQIGLIRSVRPEFEKYRFYDTENVERLKQIIVLRKMQIPVKDIIRIYESDDMSTVVEVFVGRIQEIESEVGALTELKHIVSEFLQTMIKKGITKISAIPLLYEEMDKQLEMLEEHKPVSYDELNTVSERLAKPVEPAVVLLPEMRVISSYLKKDSQPSDPDGFWRWVQASGISPGRAGLHERFEFQTAHSDVIILWIDDDFVNDSDYLDYRMDGGLFASVNVYLDEDLGERFRSLIKAFDTNNYYQIDYTRDGSLRHPAMIETLISPDDQRELVSLLVPVKKRMADPTLFDKPVEIPPSEITVEEIEAQNPTLWTVDVPMDGLIPINSPHYKVTEQGEAEYISWIMTRVLSTDVKVQLPFRVDIAFRIGEESGGYGHGVNDNHIRFSHGNDLNYYFGINMKNNNDERLSQEAICFHQPVFGDYFQYPKRGGIMPNAYNRLTWIVGMKHFAVIINDEMRYCGVNFPYMTTDLSRRQALPIIIGATGSMKKYFKSIRISQLAQTQKSKIKEGALTMITKQSNNSIPNIHRFITSEHGENYWFNGCARYVMGALGRSEYDYEFFAGLTGDVFAQVYSYDYFRGEGVTDFILSTGNAAFVEDIFGKCGYASTFVPEKQLKANKEMYIQTLIAYIDKGVPVISSLVISGNDNWLVFVGYEEYGKTLLFMTDNMTDPERVSSVDVFAECEYTNEVEKACSTGWIFVGEEKEHMELAKIYRDVIVGLPKLLTTKNDKFCFGAEAFRVWADGIESGKFDDMKPEEFRDWHMHNTYICNMATNGSCCHGFLAKARELNPELTFIDDLHRLYKRTADIWNNDNGNDLEALGGGFNVTLEALQDKKKRSKIAARLREAAECMDEVVKIVEKNM